MMGLNVVLQMIRRSRRVEVSMVPEPDARARFAGQVQSLRLVMEQHPHVWIQLPLDPPGIPGRGGEQENISVQQILWLRFLGHRFFDLPAWGNALQRVDQRIHHVLRVTASRGKNDMEDSTLNEVRDSLGGIGGVVHDLPPLSTRAGFIYRAPRSTVSGWPTLTRPSILMGSFFERTHRIHIIMIMADTLLSGSALVAKRHRL
jgi:hypothetical protein